MGKCWRFDFFVVISLFVICDLKGYFIEFNFKREQSHWQTNQNLSIDQPPISRQICNAVSLNRSLEVEAEAVQCIEEDPAIITEVQESLPILTYFLWYSVISFGNLFPKQIFSGIFFLWINLLTGFWFLLKNKI